MTDTFQGGKGLSGKIERLIWKRADTEKRSKKEHFYFQSWLHQREGSTMIRPVSNCWKKVDKKQSLCDKWKTRVRPILNRRKPWKKSWLTGLTTTVVGWLGKKADLDKEKTRVRPVPFKAKILEEKLTESGWLTERSVFGHGLTLNWCAPQKMFSNPSWLTGLTTVVGWLKESLGALLLPTIVGCCITVHQTFTTSKQPRITSEEWLI